MATGSHEAGRRAVVGWRVPAVALALVFLIVAAVGTGVSAPVAAFESTESYGSTPDRSDPPSFTPPSAEHLDEAMLNDVIDVPEPAPSESVDASSFSEESFEIVEALPADEWDLDALAARLGSDPHAAFTFMRDSIRYEPYPGILRGAMGTLAARAGNAYDRAVLLAALLDRMGIQTRFALADIDPDTAMRLVDLALSPPPRPLSEATDLALGPLQEGAVLARADRDYAILVKALESHPSAIAIEDGTADAIADAARHVWVQADLGGSWVDLDPTLPDSEPGDTIAAASEVATVLPDEARQSVTIRVIVETLTDAASESVALEHHIDAASAAGSDAWLFFVPEDGGGEGVDLFGGVASAGSVVPVLMSDGELVSGTPFQAGDVVDESGGLGFGGGGGDSYLLGIRTSVTSQAPGRDPIEATQVILDRVPAGDRVAGTVDATRLDALVMGPAVPLPVAWIHHIMISTGGSNPVEHLLEQGIMTSTFQNEVPDSELESLMPDALLWPQAVADRSLVVASERVAVPALDVAGARRAIVARPRVYVASIGPDPTSLGAIARRTDLLLDRVELLAPGSGALEPRIWYGALMSALETEHGLAMARGADPGRVTSSGVSLSMSQPLTILSSSDLAELPSTAPSSMRLALESGALVLVPGAPDTSRVWWEVGPDGTTRSMLDPGLGGWEIFPGTGFASIYHFTPKNPPPTPPRTPSGPQTVKVRAVNRAGNEYHILIAIVVGAGLIAVTLLGLREIKDLITNAIDHAFGAEDAARCPTCGLGPKPLPNYRNQ